MSETLLLPQTNKRTTSNFKLGFELWEILTMLTIVLSVASGVMWFSNLQPRRLDSEFLWAEKEKHILYSKFQVTQNTAQTEFQFSPSLTLSQSCYADISEVNLDTSQYDQSLSQLSDVQQNIDSSKVQTQTNLINLSDSSGITDIHRSSTEYITTVKSRFDSQYDFAKKVLSIRQQASAICQAPFTEVKNLSENLIVSLDSFSEDSDSDTWLEAGKSFSRGMTELVDTLNTDFKGWVPEKLQNIQSNFISLFANTPVNKQLAVTTDFKVEESFKKVEFWEASYIKNNKDLENKVVFIYPRN